MKEEKIKIQINYWILSAKHDYETMLGLFKIRRYPDSLFYGHIILEKILKALVVIESRKSAPLVHDLTILVELAKIEIEDEDKLLLKSIYHFNIRSRYPDYRLKFYKICDFEYADNYLNKIIGLYKKLCQHPKLKSLPSDLPNF
jgi:HEPN domain-containing protein